MTFRFPDRRAVTAMAVVLAALAGAGAHAGAPPPAPAPAPAAPPSIEEGLPTPRVYVGLRGGASSLGKRTLLCLDASPFDFLSLDACGTGSGLLHRDPEPEVTHFRANLRLARLNTFIGQVEAFAGLGFAEIQVGDDDWGFQFKGVGPRGVETAGPELAASVRVLFPLGGGFEMIGHATAGAFYARHAGDLVVPQSELQTFTAITIGVGF